MVELAEKRQVTCQLEGENTYGRCVGICCRDGQYIAAAIIAASLGRNRPRYSGGRYGENEAE